MISDLKKNTSERVLDPDQEHREFPFGKPKMPPPPPEKKLPKTSVR